MSGLICRKNRQKRWPLISRDGILHNNRFPTLTPLYSIGDVSQTNVKILRDKTATCNGVVFGKSSGMMGKQDKKIRRSPAKPRIRLMMTMTKKRFLRMRNFQSPSPLFVFWVSCGRACMAKRRVDQGSIFLKIGNRAKELNRKKSCRRPTAKSHKQRIDVIFLLTRPKTNLPEERKRRFDFFL